MWPIICEVTVATDCPTKLSSRFVSEVQGFLVISGSKNPTWCQQIRRFKGRNVMFLLYISLFALSVMIRFSSYFLRLLFHLEVCIKLKSQVILIISVFSDLFFSDSSFGVPDQFLNSGFVWNKHTIRLLCSCKNILCYFCSCLYFQVNSFTNRLLGLVFRQTDAWNKILGVFNVGTASGWIVRLFKGLNTCLSRLSLKLHSSGKLWMLLLISRWFTRSKCGRRRSLHSPFSLLLPPALRAAVLRLFAFLSVNKCLSDPRRGV